MKNRIYIRAAVVFCVLFASEALGINNPAIENPAVKSPVGPATVPVSSYRSGLVRSPNPIDPTSSLLMTGNIRSGKHFRGVLPYQATTDFAGRLGSSTLDSFYRGSAGSEDFGRYIGKTRPFYSPTGTVTTTRAGLPGVFKPVTTKISSRVVDTFDVSHLFKQPTYSQMSMPVYNMQTEPMTMPTLLPREQLERLLGSEYKNYPQWRKLTVEQRKEQLEKFRRDLQEVRARAAKLKLTLDSQYEPSRLLVEPKYPLNMQQFLESQKARQQTEETAKQPDTDKQPDIYEQFDIYEQMKRRLAEVEQTGEQLPIAKPIKKAADSSDKTVEEGSQQEKSRSEKISDIISTAAKAKVILGKHETFASYSKDKFNQLMRDGENYLKEGRYYKAIDSYTLASLYKPNDPLAMAGKSHALFVAGEYVSSALFLSRALETFPGYARFKIDIVAMVGDRDKLEDRIVDVEEWLTKIDAPELKFLLGYVYYQMGRIEKAKEAIDAAYERMSDVPAVKILKGAIDDAISDVRQ